MIEQENKKADICRVYIGMLTPCIFRVQNIET